MTREFEVGQRVEIAPWFFSDPKRMFNHDGTITQVDGRRVEVKRDCDDTTGWYYHGDLHPVRS
jgi:hypothetical protein